MADLTNILGGPWRPGDGQRQPPPPEVQLREQMRQSGVEPPETVTLDGKIHRFATSRTGRDDAGWYVAYADNLPAGRFGDWRTGVQGVFRADPGRTLSNREELNVKRRLEEAKRQRDEEAAKRAEVTEDVVTNIWEGASPASPEHPYLAAKGIQPHGARVTGDGNLIVPLYSPEGELSSLQYITPDGGKKYHPGGATKGRLWIVGTADGAEQVYIAEGYATAASIHEATGAPCAVAYSAQNIVPVTGTVREAHPRARLIIVADNDEHGVGQNYGHQAAAKYGGEVVVPPIDGGDANDYAQAGGDLATFLHPPQDEFLVQADEFSQEPAPISWLVKRWVQRGALHMVHGPPGGGKTFQVLDWALRIASPLDDWQGHAVRNEPVVYLAGEGHHGLRSRVKAWKMHNGVDSLNMWLSKAGCDLNLPEGYQRVACALRSLPSPPACIVVDTLHRFLNGDENSAQDTRTMLDACAALQEEFGAAVVLVHHTGVSEEAQHRARGSSAWRGALDVETSVIPGKENEPIQLIQRKVKDAEEAEPVYVDLQTVELPGWVDEDGEAVTSAVAVPSDGPTKAPKKDSEIEKHRKTLERCWWFSGAELDENGRPYVTRSAVIEKLKEDGYAERTAANHAKPSDKDKLIGSLVNSEIIEAHNHGWVVCDEAQASAMLIRRGEA